ncbi:MAG: hypothetical protein QXG65_02815 [Thermoplasmata archaeon]
MTTDRRFCRFSRSPATAAFSVTEIPPDGMCLSSFLLLADAADPARILMGRLDPAAPWDHIGALDPDRATAHAVGWMLPSSHLIYGESPRAAAERILAEQLELPPSSVRLDGPSVFSEIGPPRRFPGASGHWDIGFLFRGSIAPGSLGRPKAWRDLSFVDLRTVGRAAIARSHDEVLDAAGLGPARAEGGRQSSGPAAPADSVAYRDASR